MSNGRDRQAHRESLKRFDNRSNGFGNIRNATTVQVATFLEDGMARGLRETHLRNDDGSPYEAQNADGTPKQIKGLDYP